MFSKEFIKHLIEKTNKTIDGVLKSYTSYDSLDNFIGNDSQLTQSKTKFMAPFINDKFREAMKAFDINFIEKSRDGYDYVIDGTEWEFKTTQSKSSGFTGNKHSEKRPNHILFKYEMDGNKIVKAYFATINLDDMEETAWSSGSSTASYTFLKIHASDYEKVNIIVGSLKRNPVWCKEVLEII